MFRAFSLASGDDEDVADVPALFKALLDLAFLQSDSQASLPRVRRVLRAEASDGWPWSIAWALSSTGRATHVTALAAARRGTLGGKFSAGRNMARGRFPHPGYSNVMTKALLLKHRFCIMAVIA